MPLSSTPVDSVAPVTRLTPKGRWSKDLRSMMPPEPHLVNSSTFDLQGRVCGQEVSVHNKGRWLCAPWRVNLGDEVREMGQKWSYYVCLGFYSSLALGDGDLWYELR